MWLTAKLGTAMGRERKTPKVDRQGRVGGSNRVRQDSPSFSSFFTFVWGCQESCKLSAGVSRVSLQLTAVSSSTDYQFWGWCPLKFERNRTSWTFTSNTNVDVFLWRRRANSEARQRVREE